MWPAELSFFSKLTQLSDCSHNRRTIDIRRALDACAARNRPLMVTRRSYRRAFPAIACSTGNDKQRAGRFSLIYNCNSSTESAFYPETPYVWGK